MTTDDLRALGDKLITSLPPALDPEERQFRDMAVVTIALVIELAVDIKRIADAAETDPRRNP